MPNDSELDKLARERKTLEQDLQRVRGKLGNENFLRNAPPDVVAKEQGKLEELNARLAKNEESRERLGKVRQRRGKGAGVMSCPPKKTVSID